MSLSSPGVKIRATVDGIAVPSPDEDNIPGNGNAPGGDPERKPRTRSKAAPQVRPRPDPYIWGIYIMLLMISVVELFSASSSEVSAANVYMPLIRHGVFLVLGLGLVLALQNIHYGYFARFAWFMALLSLLLLILSNYIGITINGAQRAINIAGFTIQPPEIVKLTVVILLATILGRNQEPRGVSNRGTIEAAFVVVLFGAFLWKNGLTNTILLFGVSLSMFLIGGMKWRKFGMVIAVYAVCGTMLYMLKYTGHDDADEDAVEMVVQTGSGSQATSDVDRSGTHKGRIQRYLEGVSPNDPIDDLNRQVIFAQIAQANGGWVGQGPGNSRESARLPLAFSDYIYSIIVEDTGFVGGMALLLIYLLLLARAGRIAYECSRAFPAFLIMGCAVLIVFQALVHMAIVTGIFPVSGQPLPLISKGGTSVLVMSAAIGIMLSVSRFAVTKRNPKQAKAELKELPDDMQAANYSNN